MRFRDIRLDDLLRNKASFLGLVIIGILAFTAIAADFIAPYDPNKIELDEKLKPPSSEHIFGTDQLGRDQLSRVIHGTQTTFKLSLIIVTITASFGVFIGITAGYFGGFIDEILMRLIDVLLAFPSIILALIIINSLKPKILNTIITISLIK